MLTTHRKKHKSSQETLIIETLSVLNEFSDNLNNTNEYHDKQEALFAALQHLPFDSITPELFDHIQVKQFLVTTRGQKDQRIILWLLIGCFLVDSGNQSIKEEINSILTIMVNAAFWNNQLIKHTETMLLPEFLTEIPFIRNIYLMGNIELISLFEKHIPAPRSHVFHGYDVPDLIREREQEATKIIKRFIAQNVKRHVTFEEVEVDIIKIQRIFRAKRRRNEEISRLKIYAGKIIPYALADANWPYRPLRCNSNLARRIMRFSKKVNVFPSVRHLTTSPGLTAILNDALYARRTLLQSYIPFTKSALTSGDIRDGDFNAICLAPNNIDSIITESNKDIVEIVFDFEKILQQRNPCLFYKQRDFGFGLNKIRRVNLGKNEILFTHTNVLNLSEAPTIIDKFLKEKPEWIGKIKELNPGENHVNFQLFRHGKLHALSNVSKVSLIAYDANRIHQILTLNFFRFIDRLIDMKFYEHLAKDEQYECKSYQKEIYSELENLNDEELIEVLQQIFNQMTDTCEVNFYGAHKIDLSSIKTITSNVEAEDQRYTLVLPEFISLLQAGDLTALHEAKTHLPMLFNSYRFINYLLERVYHQAIVSQLQDDKRRCLIPPLLQELETATAGEIEADADIESRVTISKDEFDIRHNKNLKRMSSSCLLSQANTFSLFSAKTIHISSNANLNAINTLQMSK